VVTGTPTLPPLAIPLTSFIGREHELAEIRRLLATTRLLTLAGAAGIGKTRLALQVAAEIQAQGANNPALVELAPLADPERVAEAVAMGLGIPYQADPPPVTLLVDALRPFRLLLLLDNCEHIVSACAELANQLLRGCPNLTILATSREPLGIAGEIVWRVPSLSVPESEHDRTAEQVARSEAARLFVERGRAMLPNFTLSERNAPIIAELCGRLDGIPLALELAAARLTMLSVGQITERLTHALGLLTVGSRTAPNRQQTLRTTLDWSYELLSEPERRLFERLSVFAGGWTLEAAEAICVGKAIASAAVLDLLGSLVMKSLVLVQPDLDERYRYRFLETLRQYGSERLAEHGDLPRYRRRHAEYFLKLRRQAEPDLGGARTYPAQLEQDNDNLRVALRWCVENGGAQAYQASRVIVLDPLQRVLLFRYEDQVPLYPDQPELRSFWVTPGGVLEGGETFENAALRELAEETGITGVVLGPCVWVSYQAYFWRGEPAVRVDRYFVTHVQDAWVDTIDMPADERLAHPEFRWWTTAELRATMDTTSPPGFVDLLESVLRNNTPSVPIRIAGDRFVEDAIAAALATPPPRTGNSLTARELEVATLIARGRSNRQIAEHLVVARSTAERHVANILAKLDLSSRTQIAAWAIEQGVLADTVGRAEQHRPAPSGTV
jgi:predicted ATPase/DNA-binding CsgD family transcriptional regulator/ADP-ribose pyrophosphatase YjhB (NUDIX family)